MKARKYNLEEIEEIAYALWRHGALEGIPRNVEDMNGHSTMSRIFNTGEKLKSVGETLMRFCNTHKK